MGVKTQGFVSVACVTPAAAAGDCYAEISANLAGIADMENLGIVEIGFITLASTEASVGLKRTSAVGTPTAGGTLMPSAEYDDSGTVPGAGWMFNAWNVSPTPGAGFPYFRQVTLPASAGSSCVWTWDAESPLIVPEFTSIVLVNFGAAAGPALNAWAKWASGLITALPTQRDSLGPT